MHSEDFKVRAKSVIPKYVPAMVFMNSAHLEETQEVLDVDFIR